MSLQSQDQSHMHQVGRDVGVAVAKIAPPVVAWFTLNDWLAVLSIAYVVLQAGYLLWKWQGEWRKRHEGR